GSIKRPEILERLDDVRMALAEAHSALAAEVPDAVNVAAAKLARCRWITGAAWRRHLHEAGELDEGTLLARAMAEDVGPIAAELERRLKDVTSPALVKNGTGPALACAACGKAAVAFATTPRGVHCGTLSPVNHGPLYVDEAGATLTALIEAGDARAVLNFLSTEGGPGCDAWCPDCNRLYCKDHYAIEAKWSGSWHEATDATCPLGHWREIE
ncbi:MAG TPA: hypothetical protein VGI83_06695, partial [Gemmatimonadales bacterium]